MNGLTFPTKTWEARHPLSIVRLKTLVFYKYRMLPIWQGKYPGLIKLTLFTYLKTQALRTNLAVYCRRKAATVLTENMALLHLQDQISLIFRFGICLMEKISYLRHLSAHLHLQLSN